MVARKKPRNTAIGRGVLPRLVGEGRPNDRDGHTWGGRVTVRRIDGTPVDRVPAPPVTAPRRSACPNCGRLATPDQYVDQVRVGREIVLRHVICPATTTAATVEPAQRSDDNRFAERRPVTAFLPREGRQVDAFATASRGAATRVIYDHGGVEKVAWVPSEGVRPRRL